MDALVVFYDMKNVEPKKRTKILDSLFGKQQQSNYGKFSYQVKGILPEGSYIKPIRASLIVKKRYIRSIQKLFDENAISYKIFTIIVQKEDFEKKQIF